MDSATTHIETENNKPVLSDSRRVPELRFKEFDGDIEETLFGSHYLFHTTNSLSRDKLNYDKGEVRNIHYGDIHTKFQTHFYLTNEYVPLINEDVDLAKIKEDSYCKVGDLVIADASEDYADIGKSIELIDINNEKLLAGLHTFLARPSSESTAVGYMSCLLKSWKLRKQIMTIAQGTKVLSLSTGRVSKLKLNLPTLPEQQKIASFLSAVDDKVQQLTKKKALLEDYKKGVMQQLFNGQLRFKDENGKDYPDWEENTFGGVARFINGKAYKQAELLDKGKYRVLRVGNLFTNNEWYHSDLELDEDKYIDDGDLIYAWSASFGPRFWNEEKVIYHYHIWKVVPNHDADKLYLFHAFMSDVDSIKSQSQGGTMFHITKGNIESRKFSFPCLEEQQKIATYLSRIDTKIESVNTQITQTQAFKKGLLQLMFV
ncbi:MAG: type I restriction enzyme S subunit [Psychroserpens sp.]|jgi:type I restriction enzyme S subunit